MGSLQNAFYNRLLFFIFTVTHTRLSNTHTHKTWGGCGGTLLRGTVGCFVCRFVHSFTFTGVSISFLHTRQVGSSKLRSLVNTFYSF